MPIDFCQVKTTYGFDVKTSQLDKVNFERTSPFQLVRKIKAAMAC
jgi:hypothetical protein